MSKRNKVISVELNDNQQKQFDEWCGHLKALYGEVGPLTWKISPTGIGEGIVVSVSAIFATSAASSYPQ